MHLHRNLIFAAALAALAAGPALAALAAGPALAQEGGLDAVEMSITISPVTDVRDVEESTILDGPGRADEPGEYTIHVPLHGDRDADRDHADGAERDRSADHEGRDPDRDHDRDHDGSPDLDLERDHDRASDVGGEIETPDTPDSPDTDGDTHTGDAEHGD